jgi:hypothetical protein
MMPAPIAVQPQYHAVVKTKGKKSTVTLMRTDFRTDEPCSSFKRYKGIRFPYCTCMPCFYKFFETRKDKGCLTASFPVGWSPYNTTKLQSTTEVGSV